MNGDVTSFPSFPRAVRPAPDPLGLYLRPGRNDHRDRSNLIAAGDASCFGLVLDPCLMKRHGEVYEQALKHRLDAILDPKTQQSALPGGYSAQLGALPWGVGRPHSQEDFHDSSGRRLVAAIGDFVLAHGFTQVLAPTHLLRSADDTWFASDIETTRRLRDHLDRGVDQVKTFLSSTHLRFLMPCFVTERKMLTHDDQRDFSSAGNNPAQGSDAVCRRREPLGHATGDRLSLEPGQGFPAPGRTEASARAGIRRRSALGFLRTAGGPTVAFLAPEASRWREAS